MFKDRNALAIVPCSDIGRAKAFYADTLGLPIEREMGDDVVTFRTGATFLNVYRTDKAGTNQANAVVWGAGDQFEAIVADLQSSGVTFEHYDLEGMTLDGDVHRMEGFGAVWFKDPDGNLLHINSLE